MMSRVLRDLESFRFLRMHTAAFMKAQAVRDGG
jgi:hypothetical protein